MLIYAHGKGLDFIKNYLISTNSIIAQDQKTLMSGAASKNQCDQRDPRNVLKISWGRNRKRGNLHWSTFGCRGMILKKEGRIPGVCLQLLSIKIIYNSAELPFVGSYDSITQAVGKSKQFEC